jgi:hypothetical protein
MAKAYHIVQWHLYESSDLRKTAYMSWYKKQTKLTGIGVGLTMLQGFPRNAVLMGTWGFIETLASLSALEHRGWLVRNGVPMVPEDMSALIPTVPATAFQEALDWFSQPRVNWVEHVEFVPTADGTPGGPGKLSRQYPGTVPVDSEWRDSVGTNSARERERESTERQKEESGEKRKGSELVPDREGQTRQFAAAGARVQELEAVDPERRSAEQDRELKKMRWVRKEIQKKQARGDFSLVTD